MCWTSSHFRVDHSDIVDFHSALTFPDRDLRTSLQESCDAKQGNRIFATASVFSQVVQVVQVWMPGVFWHRPKKAFSSVFPSSTDPKHAKAFSNFLHVLARRVIALTQNVQNVFFKFFNAFAPIQNMQKLFQMFFHLFSPTQNMQKLLFLHVLARRAKCVFFFMFG